MIRKLGIFTGIICILGATILSIAYGFTVGNFIAFIIGALLIILSLWFYKLSLLLKRIVRIFIITIISTFLFITGMIIIRGSENTVNYNEECVIVLGSGIRGEIILPTLKNRLDALICYHRKNNRAIIILSGGQGPKESISESEAMKRYLSNNGIPDSLLIKENNSRNTRENIIFSKKIADDYFNGDNYSIAIITSHYHIFRTERTALKQNIHIHTKSAAVDWYLLPSAYTREFLSILKFWLIG